MTKKQKATDLITQAVESARPKLTTDKLPSPEGVREMISDCISRSGGWRKSPPDPKSKGRLLWDLVKFHRGSGSLWGYPHFADPQERDLADTLAVVILTVFGNGSSAAKSWKRALHGE